MGIIEKASQYAKHAHEGQMRKVRKNVPMFQHVEEVANILKYAGFSDETVAAGYLHDVVEDTKFTSKDILDAFGKKVAFIVAGHTEDKEKSWEERKQATIDELADPNTAIEIRALIIADRLSNLRGFKGDKKVVGDQLWTYFKRGEKEQEWYYRGCLENMAVGLKENEIPDFFFEYEREVNEFFSN